MLNKFFSGFELYIDSYLCLTKTTNASERDSERNHDLNATCKNEHKKGNEER